MTKMRRPAISVGDVVYWDIEEPPVPFTHSTLWEVVSADDRPKPGCVTIAPLDKKTYHRETNKFATHKSKLEPFGWRKD